jgi:hypothetical protein
MNRKTVFLSVTLLAGSLCGTSAVFAQTTAEDLPPALKACTEEVDVMRRLSCYDREMRNLQSSTVPETPAPPEVREKSVAADQPPLPRALPTPERIVPEAPRQVPDAPPAPPMLGSAAATAAANKSLTQAPEVPASAESPPAEASPPVAAGQPAPTAAMDDFGLAGEPMQISATVVDLRRRPYGELIILLDNQQIWEQKHVDRRFRLEIGEQVTIKRGAVGGYRLSGSSNNSIQVARRK